MQNLNIGSLFLGMTLKVFIKMVAPSVHDAMLIKKIEAQTILHNPIKGNKIISKFLMILSLTKDQAFEDDSFLFLSFWFFVFLNDNFY